MRLLLASVLLSLNPPALAGVSDQAYDRAVDLVDRLYLYPHEVRADRLLEGAARGLADEIDWLLVETAGGAVQLRHGDGTAIGAVSVANMETLPEALRALEAVVRDSGFDTGPVDLRLEILKGMTTALDRYSRVLAGERLERFDVRLKGTVVGVGATFVSEGGVIRVKDLTEGGPAELGGLRVGDVIVRVDGVSTMNMPLTEAARLVRGEVDTSVILTVRRDGQLIDLDLTRAEVVVANVEHRVLPDGIGYLRIQHFSQRTRENMVKSLDDLRALGALSEGLVLDLRGNTGGSMKEAARAADLFLREGMLLRTAGPDGARVQNLQARMDALDEGDEPAIPLVVLTDDRTASGSEILAGALVQLERAALIGTRTYGKGTVQKIYNLDEEARLKLTVAQYVLAGDRRITEDGLVPDVVLGRVTLDGHGVRFHDWEEERSGGRFETIVPVLEEKEGWRGQAGSSGDVALELARRSVLGARGGSRGAVLRAVATVAEEVRGQQEAALAEALEAKGIAWDAAVAEGPEPHARVLVRAVPDPLRADVIAIQAEVENLGEEPLHRVLVELQSETFYAWDGLVVPVGRIEPGELGLGTVEVPLPAGIEPRQDEVVLQLRAHRRPMHQVGREVLPAESTPIPRIAVSTRIVPHGSDHRAEVTVRNLADATLTGVEVQFVSHGQSDLELLDHSAVTSVVPARGEVRLDLGLHLGAAVPSALPLDLVVQSERYRKLIDWPLSLPVDGSTASFEAPRVVTTSIPRVAAPGPLDVAIQVSDEHQVDHVVLYVNGHKHAWAGGGRAKAELRTRIPLVAGQNRLVVLAQDDQGLRTRELVYVWAEGHEASVDAGEE